MTCDMNSELIESEKKIMHNNSYIYDSTIFSAAMIEWIDLHSESMFAVWDIKGKIVFISQSVKRLLGFDPDTFIGKVGTSFILPSDKIKLIKRFENDMKNTPGQLIHFNMKDNEDGYRQIECKIERIIHENKSFFIGKLTDLSHEAKKRERLIESEKMSIAGQFAAGIAHEIRNPLTSIKGFLQLLQSGVTQKNAYYKIMIDEIDKLESITSELLFISKPLTNKKKAENLSSMINDVMVLLRPQVKSKNIIWDIKQIDENATIRCDRSQIKQVLINLIKNAIEAIDDTGIIKIKVSIIKSHIELIIVDNGIGINEELIKKMNDPFFTTKEGGTGLGLMISKQILDQHHTSMSFSQNKNNGCTVRLLFPFCKVEQSNFLSDNK